MKEGPTIKKRGQITIFVIIALVIIVLGILIYFFFPGIKTTSTQTQETPQTYFQNCIQQTFEDNVNTIAIQGGSMNASPGVSFNGTNVQYLCYTNQYYKANANEFCVPQQALLINHIENEIKKSVQDKVSSCLDEMKADYINKGYTVTLNKKDFGVYLSMQTNPGKIVLEDNSTFSLTKGQGQAAENYNSFDVVLNNNLYELATTAMSIVNWEKNLGNSNPVYFMTLYPELRVEQIPQTNGIKVYVITYKNTGEKFQFAVRSLVIPPGIPTPQA